MYPKISLLLTTAIAIFSALANTLPSPIDTNTKASTCSAATLDTTCIDTYNSCMTSASGDNDAIESCALTLSTCTSTTAKRDSENQEKRVATVCTNGAVGSVTCVGTFATCMQAAVGAGQITSCALALSACEVEVNTK
ncbi:hypothetical protein BOTCAL_0051g00170 [Botryotinia calthae]|uniref:Extracellular membrane protein CFEM domain-containing protein n=1 Tax=Botryotinia calthae TaxID=38488 RepID=A0A4Y8DBC4_9HELO|nr:hypothetical protein BOTCAL_0051g00170 [Botryotinia calthae]